MHEKLFWGLPYCVLSPDRWLTVFLSPLPLSLSAKKEGSWTECTAQTWQRDLEGRVTFFCLAIHAGQPRVHTA